MALPEASQVDDKESGDVVRLAPQVLLPKALLPEPEALHVLVVVAEGSEAKGSALQPGWTGMRHQLHAARSGRQGSTLVRSCQRTGVGSQCNAAATGAWLQPPARKCSAQVDGRLGAPELCPPIGTEH